MKGILLIICTLLAFTAIAQTRNCDLSLRVVAPTDNYVLPFGDTVDVVVCVKNNGPDSILRSDTLLIGEVGSNIYSAMVDTFIAPGDSLVWPIMSGWADADIEENDTLYTCLFLEHRSMYYADSVSNNDSLCFTVVFAGSNSTSINENDKSSMMSVYPNPSSDWVYINSQSLIKRLDVIDMMGRIVSTIDVNTTNAKVDLSALPAGVYVISITDFKGVKAIQKVQKL